MLQPFHLRRIGCIWASLLLFGTAAGPAWGAPPPAPVAARFLKALSMGLEGTPKLATQDATLLVELKTMGVAQEAGAKIAWAANSQDVKLYLSQKKLVVVPTVELLDEGGAIAVTMVDGRFSVFFDMGNAK
jgi:hypothetical protein